MVENEEFAWLYLVYLGKFIASHLKHYSGVEVECDSWISLFQIGLSFLCCSFFSFLPQRSSIGCWIILSEHSYAIYMVAAA